MIRPKRSIALIGRISSTGLAELHALLRVGFVYALCGCAVVNEAPFHLAESGYGGFLLPVDIYLRTTCEPRRLRFLYDLQLDSTCSVACVRYEKLVFWNPAEPLRSALRRSGAVSKRSIFLCEF